MDDALTGLFNNFDRGQISRRQLLQALGIAAVAGPVTAYAQGRCGAANAGSPGCDTTPYKAPFESTGWKTVLLDHFSVQVVDYQKEAAYYSALMGWKVRSDDGRQAVLDIGDFGGMIIRPGYSPPPAVPTPPRPAPAGGDSAAAGRGGAGGAGRGGAGRGGAGGGAGRGGAAAGPPRVQTPLNEVWESFCWGITPWDTKKVEAALRARGMDPIADHDGSKDFYSFHVKDPDGFDLQISNGNKTNRRKTPPAGRLAVAAPFASPGWKTSWLDHISFNVGNYKESTAFYAALLGWTPTGDEGSQNETEIGDIGNIIIRGGNPTTAAAAAAAGTPRRARMDHVAFGITPWDTDGVAAALTKRGLSASADTGGKGDIHDAKALYKSYHTTTPQGYNLQISNASKVNRTVR
jgi:catechol 2,3-dioxygenase-like lactoylglutathione lyase family enzyme